MLNAPGLLCLQIAREMGGGQDVYGWQDSICYDEEEVGVYKGSQGGGYVISPINREGTECLETMTFFAFGGVSDYTTGGVLGN